MLKDGGKQCPRCRRVPLPEEWTLHSGPCGLCRHMREDWCIYCCSREVSTGGEYCAWIAEWAEEERSLREARAEDEALDSYL